MNRRDWLHWSLGFGLCAQGQADANPSDAGNPSRQRVVVVGGGWAGLSCAYMLRRLAPELDVVLIDRESVFKSLPLSSAWLVGRTGLRLPSVDVAALARDLGYRFVSAEVQQIDRSHRSVQTTQGAFAYDWLVVASGVAYDYAAWLGPDPLAHQMARQRFPSGFMANELDGLQQRLHAFQGGNLVLTVPPAPYRCPPAPYERAMLLAWWLKRQGRRGKIVLLDAGGGMQRFTRMFERYGDLIDFRPHTVIREIDVGRQKIVMDEGELTFEHAMILPPMRASELVEQAGLAGVNTQGQTTSWAKVDPLRLRAVDDARVYLAGDLVGVVSPLFGHYPKTAHMAVRQGQWVAQQVAAVSRGLPEPSPVLPDSVCHVWLDADPVEQMQLQVQYRLRGDGVLVQSVQQRDNPQPRDEDLQWANGLLTSAMGLPKP